MTLIGRLLTIAARALSAARKRHQDHTSRRYAR